jgi:uncharacterized protein (DUF4415 family)
MRKEYDLKKLRVKRRGPLPSLEGQAADAAKVRVTVPLDRDVVEHFKAEAQKPGALPYQTQINRALRWLAFGEAPEIKAIKTELLKDSDFLSAIVDEVERRQHA